MIALMHPDQVREILELAEMTGQDPEEVAALMLNGPTVIDAK